MIAYRRATSADASSLLELYSRAFGKTFSYEWWMWYRNCPNGPNRTSIATALGGHLAGAYSLMPMWLKLGERIVGASLCNNVCTHPDYQRRGVFVALGKHALDDERSSGTRVSLGMPNEQALPGHLAVGWKQVVPLSLLVKKNPQVRRHFGEPLSRFTPETTVFLGMAQAQYALAIARDHIWLNWRYTDRPEREYRSLVLEHDGVMRGYCVVKHFSDGETHKSHVMDLQALDAADALELLDSAENLAAGRDELTMWTNPRDPWRETILLHGFEERPTSDRLIMHTNYGTPVSIPDGPVCFHFGDNDPW